VPYLLGFHPAQSIVVLGMRETALIFHARSDLPSATAPRSEIKVLARYLRDVLRSQDVDGVILIGFGTQDEVSPTLRATADAVRSIGLTLLDELRAHDGKYWSYRCVNPECCSPDGTRYDIAGTVVAAEATLAGCVALPDRAALVRTLGPPSGPSLVAIQHSTRDAAQRLATTPSSQAIRAGRDTLHTATNRYATGSRLTDDEVAWLTVLLAADRKLRDLALSAVERARKTDIRQATHIALWTDVVRRCDPGQVAAPAVLLAYACWRTGDGVRAGVAVERALDANPQCASAQLMAQLLRHAVPPTATSSPTRPRQRSPRPRTRFTRSKE
jgi:hypothetical protein